MASAVSLGSTVWLGVRVRTLAPAAALTASQSVTRESSRNCLVPSRGLVTMSTAPYSRALKVLCAPSSARLEQMTTGIGCWLMIFLRKVSPSMRGISISSVITSGTCSRDALGRDKGIAGGGDDFDLGIGLEHVAAASGAPRRSRPRSEREFFVYS